MATTVEYIEFVCEQVRACGEIRYRKMFGEYMVYINNKPIFLVCDNTVYVKKHEKLQSLMAQAELGFPYKGSKEHYILDIDNVNLSEQVGAVLETITPIPKPKKKKS